ncbi:DUF3395 domain-containing protein [Acidovorax sp. DW039]|uniref:DNAJC11 domain-containing protein n=1 Tax=Acidovorax sp. DW039 TaxID=3095606 RepID=UPI003087D781|nr:DUF3395 domain-containing protein [Acidovorax sp. DW039]
MLFHNPLHGLWAVLLLFFGLLGPAAAQRGGDEGAYQILSASYGTPERSVDVTERLRQLARSDQTFRVSNDVFGTDPDRGRVKSLRIYARGPNGGTRTFEYREDSYVNGAQFTGWSSGNWGQGGSHGGQGNGRDDGEFRILQALYGTSEHYVDVTRRLRDLARQDGAIPLTNDTFGVDPHRGQRKTLRIYVRTRDGQNRMFEYAEGSTIDGARFVGWGGGNWGNEGWNGGWHGAPGGSGGSYGGGGYERPNQGYGGLQIVQAVYGADNRVIDVTDRVRSRVAGDRLSVRADNELAGYDPTPGIPKMLWVTYSIGGREYRVNVRESEYLRLP